MKKIKKYINTNIVELIAIRDTVLLVAMLYAAWLVFKFTILYLV